MRGLVLFVLAALGAFGGCSRGSGPPHPTGGPRVVSLMPSGTEIVAALGATAELVGVDQFSDDPPEVRRLPRVGTYLAPDLEAIVRLAPTLVILDDVHGQLAATLKDRGIATAACAVHALADVKTCLRDVGAHLGKQGEADRVAAAMDAAVAAARAHQPAQHPRVLAIIGRDPGGLGDLVAAGPGSYLDELLAAIGGDNVLAGVGARYPRIGVEEVLRARPDVILDLSDSKDGIAPWHDLAVPAVAAGRVHALSAPYLLSPSPRVDAALADLSRAIR